MGNRIDSKTARNKLALRREPYWHKLRRGGYLGYRRTGDGGTWVARWRTDDGQRYESLGVLEEISPDEQFEAAKEQAETWFKSLGTVSRANYTVRDAIDDYVKDLEIRNGARSAYDARKRLEKNAAPTLGNIRLTKLATADLTNWLKSMVRTGDNTDDVRRSKDGANRMLSYLKAALNLAYRENRIGSDQEWRRVKGFENVGTARKVILNDAQIKQLLEKAPADFGPVLRSGLLTGARYGELVAVRVEDLDAKNGTLHLTEGKTGPRDVYLNDAALRHFKALAKDKLPQAYLHAKADGTPWGKSHQQRPMVALVKAAKLPKETTFYALRHTHISRALLAGVNAQVVAENCGTSVRMIEKHYAKFLRADRRKMFNKVKLA